MLLCDSGYCEARGCASDCVPELAAYPGSPCADRCTATRRERSLTTLCSGYSARADVSHHCKQVYKQRVVEGTTKDGPRLDTPVTPQAILYRLLPIEHVAR